MRPTLALGYVPLICICIAAGAQPAFAQNDGQIHAGICRSGNCGAPEAPPPPCGDGKRGLVYFSPPSGRGDLHGDPSTGSPVVTSRALILALHMMGIDALRQAKGINIIGILFRGQRNNAAPAAGSCPV
jgi:hypothetical protein